MEESNVKLSDLLDYKIENIDDRLQLVNEIIKENDSYLVSYYDHHFNPHLNQTNFLSENTKMSKDLEALADYILYAKDNHNDDLITDYKKKRNTNREASIDVTIKVTDVKVDNNKSIIKFPKIKVTKDDRLEHIELEETGKMLDGLTSLIKTGKYNNGEDIEKHDIRRLKWIRTDIQKDEVAVKNELKGYIRFQSITKSEKDLNALSNIRFDDIEIIRILIEEYSEFKESSYDDTFGYLKLIMITLDSLIEKTEMEDYELDILRCKIDNIPYDNVIALLKDKYNMNMTKPRLSKITREKIPSMIVDSYKQQKEDWVYTFIIRGTYINCTSCKRNILAIKKYFSPASKNKSGFRSTCKSCRNKKRSVVAKSE